MTDLELLAPAKNIEIGIAAIDCGADAVYIAGPAFGARQAAGNSMDDLAELCRYAHKFGARVFMTLNTIIYDEELESAYKLMCQAEDAGIDALIVQDLAVARMASSGPDGRGRHISIPLHASTQCAIQTEVKALFYRELGFSRLVLERELSLDMVRKISSATGCEIEFFVHGALCVCYSGQCYMSESIAGRSANRGECIQACRSLYDLVDGDGKEIMKNKALLSLKDYNLLHRLEDLADAGVCSFKIEGRLKNISYVKNTVTAYSRALNKLVSRYPDKYRRASFGKVEGGFEPDLAKTFNRGYTQLFLDGKRGKWASMNTPKGMGEAIGSIKGIRPYGKDEMEITVAFSDGKTALGNGDGFAVTGRNGEIIGFRGDVCSGNTIRCRQQHGVEAGMTLYRNISAAFEKSITASPSHRIIQVNADITLRGNHDAGYTLHAEAGTEDGRAIHADFEAGHEAAGNKERMSSMIINQINKASGCFQFNAEAAKVSTDDGAIPFMPASFLNGVRRALAEKLDGTPALTRPLRTASELGNGSFAGFPPPNPDFRFNVANRLAKQTYMEHGAVEVADAYELSHQAGAELMRTRYCIRYELGICLKHGGSKVKGPLRLINNGRSFTLGFDCNACEMTVKES